MELTSPLARTPPPPLPNTAVEAVTGTVRLTEFVYMDAALPLRLVLAPRMSLASNKISGERDRPLVAAAAAAAAAVAAVAPGERGRNSNAFLVATAAAPRSLVRRGDPAVATAKRLRALNVLDSFESLRTDVAAAAAAGAATCPRCRPLVTVPGGAAMEAAAWLYCDLSSMDI